MAMRSVKSFNRPDRERLEKAASRSLVLTAVRTTFAPGEIEQATQDIAEITNYAAAATLAQQA
jgi:hypothetical protein